MLERALPLLILLGSPAVVVSQAPSLAPQPSTPSIQADPVSAPAEEQRQYEQELQRLIASQEALTKEIQRLRKITGQHQQVLVSVKICELSLSKARMADFNVEGVDSKALHANGFAGALSAGELDESGQVEGTRRVKSGNELVYTRVIENDEVLQKVITELERAGALKVVAEPTLTTVSGRPASFHAGGEFPIPVAQPSADSTIEFRAFGTQIDLVPVVLGTERILLELRPHISEIDPAVSVVLGDLTVPGLRVRGVNTSVEMNVGHTFVLAGLVQQRVIQKALEESGEADMDPERAPSKSTEGNTGSSQDDVEETELIVVVRAQILDAL